MRHGSSGRRQRNRGNQGRRSNNKNQVFDSNGPDVRIRGTAFQVSEKYLALAKDCLSAGDDILAQSYLQHAEHYQRIINSWAENDASIAAERAAREEKAEESNEATVTKTNASEDTSGDDLSLPGSILGEGVKVSSEELESA